MAACSGLGCSSRGSGQLRLSPGSGTRLGGGGAAPRLRRSLAPSPSPAPQQPRQQRLQPAQVWPFDLAWGASVDYKTLWDTLPQNLFALSLFPYLGFLYHLTRSKQSPPLALFGWYFLLAFVFATIPAGIYAKKVYNTALANVDWLHGSAEFLLTLTNLFIVLGMRSAIRKAEADNAAKAAAAAAGGAAAEERQPAARRED
ncbi:1-acyl-sn-glycerol-3-phosphate acyltransferase delta isoform 1 [Chlorella sorokiniana]|uniref:1-acyl-sn-glycerol-3-phosphate acyltransferase delta isoform 1 n=1 Tax=Chlorella sorokiniana TaxID=3076 RepID=A0A2P6TS95_CHLSO|nr:1-acyl-sn-glycerol-3-phosphate acyltransferase delta isoform 1 [Chlorella sorokiniana]|eukprot:PRW56941.1 1-acyl-sn-glycerol-3-phosphate acyltransferase delta isoform 1 [Chlorella sorokiniana]